jgi:uncharacterized protein
VKTSLLIPVLAAALVACGGATKPAEANRSGAAPVAAAPAPAKAAPATAPATAAVDFPALNGRVVDSADLLTPAQEAGLSAELEGLERRTTDQLVVVTVPSLGGRDIEGYSRDLGNHWRIGQAGGSNGVLLVVAPEERRVRIEVGRGLTSTLTNQRAQEIIDRDLVPQFRASRWHDGIQTGTRAIIAALTAAPSNAKVSGR